jgi:hypothetical protein
VVGARRRPPSAATSPSTPHAKSRRRRLILEDFSSRTLRLCSCRCIEVEDLGAVLGGAVALGGGSRSVGGRVCCESIKNWLK